MELNIIKLYKEKKEYNNKIKNYFYKIIIKELNKQGLSMFTEKNIYFLIKKDLSACKYYNIFDIIEDYNLFTNK